MSEVTAIPYELGTLEVAGIILSVCAFIWLIDRAFGTKRTKKDND